jgi:hypothetical protein
MMTSSEIDPAAGPTVAENATPPSSEPLVESSAQPAPRRRLGGLLLGIVFWPRSTFVYLRDHGGRSWLMPLLLVAVLALAARAVAAPIEKAQADAALAAIQAQLGNQGQGAQSGGTFFVSGPAGALSSTGGPVAIPLLTYGLPVLGVFWDWLLRGAALLGLAWLLGGRPSASAVFRISGWTLIPNAVRLAVAITVMIVAHREPLAGLQGLGAPPSASACFSASDAGCAPKGQVTTVQIGPGGGGGALGPSFLPLLQSSFLGALDIYTLWGLLLMLIGVAVTARLHWFKSLLSTGIYWALSLALASLPPLLSFLLLTLAGSGPGTFVGK